MELIILYVFATLFLSAQAFEHKFQILHANNINRQESLRKWHFWANGVRFIVLLGSIGLIFHKSSIIPIWKVGIMAFGIAIFSGYYFSIFLNLIRGFRWNYRGNENEKDMDYYMFGGATPTIALWIVITTIILYFKL